MCDLTIHPSWKSSGDTTRCRGSDIICNNPSPPLADIVRFDPLRIAVSLTVLKHVYLGEVSTPLKGTLRSPLQPMWDLTIHPPWESSVLTGTLPGVWL